MIQRPVLCGSNEAEEDGTNVELQIVRKYRTDGILGSNVIFQRCLKTLLRIILHQQMCVVYVPYSHRDFRDHAPRFRASDHKPDGVEK